MSILIGKIDGKDMMTVHIFFHYRTALNHQTGEQLVILNVCSLPVGGEQVIDVSMNE